MTAEQREALRQQIIEGEAIVLHAYQDSLGYWTIGVGRLIDKRLGGGITRAEAMLLLDNDINRCLDDLATFPWFARLSPVRQRVVVDMRFNLGPARFRGFRKMISALERGDFETAARQMLDSKWATQVGQRATKLARMMREDA